MADVFPPQEPLPPENTPRIETPPPPVSVYDVPSSAPVAKKTNWWLISLIILLLLCCCCAVFAVFMYQVGGDWLIDNLGMGQFIR